MLQRCWAALIDNSVKVLTASLFGLIALVLSLSFNDIRIQFEDYILRIVAAQIDTADSSLAVSFDQRFFSLLESAMSRKIGALSVGSFTLDSHRPTHSFPLYVPQGYHARIFIRSKAYRFSDSDKILLIFPNRDSIQLSLNEKYNFDLADLLRLPEDAQSVAVREEVFKPLPDLGHLGDVHRVVIRIVQDDSVESDSSAPVEISYLVTISPHLELGI